MDFMKIFDLYGSYFNLRINGNGKFRSVIGGYLSLLTIGIFIWTIYSFGGDFYQRKNPKITIENGLYADADIPSIGPKALTTDKMLLLAYDISMDKVFKPYVQSVVNATYRPFQYLNYCDWDYLVNNSLILNNDSRNSRTYSYYCLNLNDFVIGSNDPTNSNYHPLLMFFDECKLMSEEYIQYYNLTSCDPSYDANYTYTNLILGYQSIGFSPNLENPLISKFTYESLYLYNDKTNIINLPLSLYSLNDDLGWLTTSVEKSLNLNFNPPHVSLVPSDQVSSYPQINININISDTYTTYSRSYTKLQDFLASIGGFMKIIFTVLNVLTSVIRSYSINNFIVDRIFDVGVNKNLPINDAKENLARKSLKNNFLQLSKSPAKDRSGTLRMLDHTFSKFSVDEKYKRKYTNNNHIGLYSYYKASLYLCLNKSVAAKTRKEKQFLQVLNKIKISDKMRDFNHIMDKMIEVDMMKSMMLNDHQSLCLNYLQKPRSIPLDNNPHRFSVLLNTNDINTQNIENYFLKILKENELTHDDKFLFEHLDNEIKMRILSNLSLFQK